MAKLKDIFEELGFYPENINCDIQFAVHEFTDFFTKKGTNICLSQSEQPHKNAIIERFWRTLALLIQRMREGIKVFDWPKSLHDGYNDNNTLRSMQSQYMYWKERKTIQYKEKLLRVL